MGAAHLSLEESPEPMPLPAPGKDMGLAVQPEEQRGPAPSRCRERLCLLLSPQRWDVGHGPAPGTQHQKTPQASVEPGFLLGCAYLL